MHYAFHLYNKFAVDGIAMAVDTLLKADIRKKLNEKNTTFQKFFDGNLNKPPVIVCIGSDLAIGDSLGPIAGSMLKYKTQGLGVFVYGTLSAPITAKEVKYLRTFFKETHPGSQIIAVDAAVGEQGDIGLIKLQHAPLYPGAGANKKLGAVGDISVMGIVAEKSVANFGLLNTTRLNLVYTMSEIISDALSSVLWQRKQTATAQ